MFIIFVFEWKGKRNVKKKLGGLEQGVDSILTTILNRGGGKKMMVLCFMEQDVQGNLMTKTEKYRCKNLKYH